MTAPVHATRKDALAAHWFSRRHETREAHDAAREHFFNKVNANNAPKLGFDKRKLAKV